MESNLELEMKAIKEVFHHLYAYHIPEKRMVLAADADVAAFEQLPPVRWLVANGWTVEVKLPKELSEIKILMRMAWHNGKDACDCGKCDFCIETGVMTFDKFVESQAEYHFLKAEGG